MPRHGEYTDGFMWHSVKVPSETSPAKLSTGLCELFPPGARVAEMRAGGDPSALLAEEMRHLGASVDKRKREFAAGRLCARRLLAEFGITDFPVRVADDRQPLWPESLVGSITHTTGIAGGHVAAAVARNHTAALNRSGKRG